MILREIRYTIAGLRRRPGFAVTAILSIGVGIGAATTVLSVLIAMLVRPLPYRDADRLVAVWPDKAFADREFEAIQQQATTLAQAAALSPGWLMSLTHVAVPRQLDAGRTSGDFFGLLGVHPILGRAFGAEADAPGQDRVAILSYDLWQAVFDGDPTIVGKSIVLDGDPYTVTAVMPKEFRAFAFTSDLWIPLPADHAAMYWTQATTEIFGRLRPGVTADKASAQLKAIAPRLEQEFQLASDWSVGARVVGLQESMVGAFRPMVLLLAGAVGLLLTLAAANVTTLLLVRAAERHNEVTVRVALGASAARIAKLVLTESISIGLAGGVLGMALSIVGVRLLVAILPPALPRRQEIVLDVRVLIASAALTLLVTTLVGLAPAWQSRRVGRSVQISGARNISRAGERERGLLVALEMTLALILLVGATLMGRTLLSLSHVDTGLESDHLLTMKMEPDLRSDDEYRNYWKAVLAQVDAVPGVQSAATILHLPVSGRAWDASILIEDHPLPPGEPPPRAHWQVVSSDYFHTAGVRVLRGRPFDETDVATAPRVIAVNSALADRLFPGIDPLGHRIRAGHATHDSLATIVAVVASVRHDSLTAPPGPEVYVPFSQRVIDANSLVVRTRVRPLSLVSAIRDRIWSVDRNVPISDVQTMDDRLAASLARQRMALILLAFFAAVGLLLSTVGVYGVVAFGATQRVKEIGIRMALGARPSAILGLIIGQGLGYATLGATVGLALALVLSRLMRGMVYGAPTTDWVSFVSAPLCLILVVVLASFIPARRAAQLEPTIALGE